ncbi:hypothetical protein HN51_061986 [Arachis hypogaea]
MSDSQRKGKGKATTGKRKRGEASVSIIDLMHDASLREKAFTSQEKADQLLPANDPVKFANRYCELKYSVFANSRNLYLERTLKIPKELQQYTFDQIKQRGWFFLERPLTEVNASWVREFYWVSGVKGRLVKMEIRASTCVEEKKEEVGACETERVVEVEIRNLLENKR